MSESAQQTMNFTSSLLVFVLTMSEVIAHLCITDPPQRLQTGDQLQVDCYQIKPPCGDKFPNTSSASPTKIGAGTEFDVALSIPIPHYDPSTPGNLQAFMGPSVNNLTSLGEWPVGDDSTTAKLDIQVPPEPGNYILQVAYVISDTVHYYACSDVAVVAASEADRAPIMLKEENEASTVDTAVAWKLFALFITSLLWY